MDPIKLYIRDIEKIPLLTAEQEVALGGRANRGDTRARVKMIQSNLRLVINIAKKYSYLGVPMMDLIEEGNLGLMRAVTKFKPQKGFRFSTYAGWWIKQYVTRAIANQGKTIRIPVYMIEMLSRYRKVTERLSHRLKRKPRPGEIARSMEVSVKKVREISQMVTTTYSLDMPIGESGTSEFMDIVEDENLASPHDAIGDFFRSERVESLLSKMSDRERKILSLRYGLKDGQSRTLGETAKQFGITRERVRQIEEKALKRLRAIIAQTGGEEAN